jgi:hypothetical protein
MTIDDDNEEVFDEEELSEGFDEESLDDELDDADDDLDGVETLSEEITPGDAAVVDEDEDDDEAGEVATPVEEEDDLEDDDADVELALDEVLAETIMRTAVDDDDDGPIDTETLADPFETILPKQDDEFRCASCRLLKKQSQLADSAKMLCRDCV